MAHLDAIDTYEIRKHKLHQMDLADNPERHDFSKPFYSKEEMQEKCLKCAELHKDNFVIDWPNMRYVKIK